MVKRLKPASEPSRTRNSPIQNVDGADFFGMEILLLHVEVELLYICCETKDRHAFLASKSRRISSLPAPLVWSTFIAAVRNAFSMASVATSVWESPRAAKHLGIDTWQGSDFRMPSTQV